MLYNISYGALIEMRNDLCSNIKQVEQLHCFVCFVFVSSF